MMKYVFAVLGIIAIAAGLLILLGTKSAVHEIEAFILFLIAAVRITGAEIIAAIERLTAERKGDNIEAARGAHGYGKRHRSPYRREDRVIAMVHGLGFVRGSETYGK
jgi:membrane-bound ClpP family serine protease